MPEDVYIRAMALYSSSDHASEKVTRCVNHSIEEINKSNSTILFLFLNIISFYVVCSACKILMLNFALIDIYCIIAL